MARIAIVFGGLLIALGVGGYFGTGRTSLTALIPALFGLAILGLGIAAWKETWRKNAMHTAVVIGLVGFVATFQKLIELISRFLSDPALLAQSAMSVLCAAFVVLSIKSFIDARRSRKTREAEPLPEKSTADAVSSSNRP